MRMTLLFTVLGLWAAGPAQGATFCVSTPAQFQAALESAAGNGQADAIRLRNVTFAPAAALATGSTYRAFLTDGSDIHISGGWTDAACQQRSADAGATYLLPAPGQPMLVLPSYSPADGPAPKLTISGLTMAFVNQPGVDGCAVSLNSAYGPYHIELDRVRINDSQCQSLVSGLPYRATVVVRNSVFANNATRYPLLRFYGSASASASSSAFTNNTFVGNEVAESFHLVAVNGYAGDIKHIENNVAWDNAMVVPPDGLVRTFDTAPASGTTARGNRLQALWGPFTTGAANSAGNPGFSGVGNYRPGPGSPLRDAGMPNPASGVGSTDVTGMTRVQGAGVDIGAFEAEAPLFSAGFEPSAP